jgi:hypothetical protein
LNDNFWHKQCKKIVEFKRKNGHCLVPKRYEQDKGLGHWVSTQRSNHIIDEIRLDRKRLLDEIGFAWKDEDAHNHTHDDKICHQQHAQLETEPAAQGHRKRPTSVCRAESGRMATSTNRRDNATPSCSSVEKDNGRHEKASKPSAVTNSAVLIGTGGRAVVQEKATHGGIPSCWKVLFPI